MILYKLECDAEHAFEAWFRDSKAYDSQSERGLLVCPVCGSTVVSKALMAPRIGSKRSNELEETLPGKAEAKGIQISAEATALRKKLGDLCRTIEKSCDYVGSQFAEEARKIHYGETNPKAIYGEASAEEAKALMEEGVEFGAVPWLPKENA